MIRRSKKVETEIPRQRRGESVQSYLRRMQEYRLREETRGRHYNDYDYQDLITFREGSISPTPSPKLWGQSFNTVIAPA